jgi:hypothetical protein
MLLTGTLKRLRSDAYLYVSQYKRTITLAGQQRDIHPTILLRAATWATSWVTSDSALLRFLAIFGF